MLFGVGMAVYGYCPGTGLAAIGTGSLHALAGAAGMIAGAIAFAFSFDRLEAAILPVAAFGPVRLPDLTGIPDLVWFAGTRGRRRRGAAAVGAARALRPRLAIFAVRRSGLRQLLLI